MSRARAYTASGWSALPPSADWGAGPVAAVDWRARFAWFAGVFLIVAYSQAWIAVLVGYEPGKEEFGIVRNGFLVAYAVGLAWLWSDARALGAALLRSPLLALLIGLAFVTAAWSLDPGATVRRSVALAFTTLVGVSLAARFRWSELATILAATFAALALASAVMGALTPGMGRMAEIFPGAWRGLWLEKNAFGGMMATAFLACAAAAVLNPHRRGLWSASAVLCLALVLLSTSKTSLLGAVLGAGCMVFVWVCRRGPVAAVLAVWAGVALIAAAAAVLAWSPDLLFSALGKDASLTGRTEIWEAASRQIEQRPWTGFGYGVLWDQDGAWDPLAWIVKDSGFKAGHAHNGWLETWLGFGLVGLALWSLLFAETWLRTLAGLTREPGVYLALPLLLVFSLISLTEVSVLDYHDVQWTIFCAVAVKLAAGDRFTPSATPNPGS